MIKMKVLLTLLGFILSLHINAQCAGQQSFTLNPQPTNGTYSPGTVVTVCYTMSGWNGTGFGSNWLEGFSIDLGSAWTNLTPLNPPANCNGGNGQWLWVQSTISSSTGIAAGPGFFFETSQGGPINGNPGDDWGDFGTNCNWSFCFQVTVTQQCNPQSLLIQVTAGADGTWGSWINNSCPLVPFTIFNGTTNATPVTTSQISHN